MALSVDDQVHRVHQAENLLTPTGLGILTRITPANACALFHRPMSLGPEIWTTSERESVHWNLGCLWGLLVLGFWMEKYIVHLISKERVSLMSENSLILTKIESMILLWRFLLQSIVTPIFIWFPETLKSRFFGARWCQDKNKTKTKIKTWCPPFDKHPLSSFPPSKRSNLPPLWT